MSIFIIIAFEALACSPFPTNPYAGMYGESNLQIVTAESKCISKVNTSISLTRSEDKAWAKVAEGADVYEIRVGLPPLLRCVVPEGLVWSVMHLTLDTPDPAPKKRIKTKVGVE